MNVQEQIELAPFTTLGIGGAAKYFVRVESIEELREAIEWAAKRGEELFFLGGGSNLLIADRGFDGLVVQVALHGVERSSRGDRVVVRAAAGEEWDGFVAQCVSENLAGIECLSGIPGLVGATPIQNVGAYGQDVSETIVAVEVLDRSDLSARTLTAAECEFGYRASFFKNRDPRRYVVTAVSYALTPQGSPAIRYPELRRYFDERGISAPSLQQVRDAVIEIRRRKGMVIDEADADSRSAGSFFMNPVLDEQAFAEFRERAAAVVQGSEPPAFPTPDGKVKTSAAWLIEKAGFTKGYRLGRAGLSTKHTLAIVNCGGASATDVVTLVRKIQQTVADCFGVDLHPEPNFIGFE